MPIYEYQCKNCDYYFEELQSFNDKSVKKCPNCKKNKVERLISLSAFHLQGSGWYETEYGKKKVKAGTPSPIKDNPAETGESTESSKTTETTPRSTSDSSTYDSIKKDTSKAKNKSKK